MYHSRQHVRIKFRIVTIHPHWIHSEHITHIEYDTHTECVVKVMNAVEKSSLTKLGIRTNHTICDDIHTFFLRHVLYPYCGHDHTTSKSEGLYRWPLSVTIVAQWQVEYVLKACSYLHDLFDMIDSRDNLQAKVEEGTEYEKIATIVLYIKQKKTLK